MCIRDSNMSGVIPPIFASSIIMFPATASTWFGQAGSATWLQKASQALSPGEPLHMILYAALIAGFTFFYTAVVFNSQETAVNLMLIHISEPTRLLSISYAV